MLAPSAHVPHSRLVHHLIMFSTPHYAETKMLQLMDSAKPREVAATPGWGGWGGDGVREWERAKKTLEISHKKTKQAKLHALMNADVDPSKVNTNTSFSFFIAQECGRLLFDMSDIVTDHADDAKSAVVDILVHS
jgi:hypothetical protein